MTLWITNAASNHAQSPTFAADAQHTGLYSTPAQWLNRVHWSTSINMNNSHGEAHYGAPLITAANTVLVPVRARTGFEIEAFDGETGRPKYSLATDYRLPTYNWVPAYQPVLATMSSGTRLYYPGAGGTVYYVENLDSDTPSAPVQECFYTDLGTYGSNAAAFNASVFINTALTAGSNGTVFFGFIIQTNKPPPPLGSTNGGFVRLAPDGTGAYVIANLAAGTPSVVRPPHNCAPALSNDGSTIYVVAVDYPVSSATNYLLGLDSVTLATKYKVHLQGPSGSIVYVSNDSTASPVVGPDGDIYFGASPGDHGFLLHYSGDLARQMAPGSFGWDNTPAVVPSSMVPAYTGTSTYLLFSKYNNYASGSDGINKLAILDPNATQIDSYYHLPTMREVLTVTGPTPDPSYQSPAKPYAVREWCISAAAVNPPTHSVFMPNEDGRLYRWDLAANSLSETLALEPGVSEAYVPTVLGPDGTVYTIVQEMLYACGGRDNLYVGLASSLPDLQSGLAGQAVTFTASVNNLDPIGLIPSGTVTFSDLTYQGVTPVSTTLAANVPLIDGMASVTTSTLIAASNFLGSHFITANYSGDANFPATSASLVQKVHAYASTTALTSSVPAGSNSVTLTSTLAPQAAITNIPTGMVSFWDGATFLAQLPLNQLGVASTNLNFSPGIHAFNAAYNSDTVCASSSGSVVAVPTVIHATLDLESRGLLLTFTNNSGAPFDVLSSADLSLPLCNWASLGPAMEILPGQYQFHDAVPAMNHFMFYTARSP